MSRTDERHRVRKGLIDKAIADEVQPRFPRGSANFTLPLYGGKRALLVRSDNTFTKKKVNIGQRRQGRLYHRGLTTVRNQ